jgi:4-amino-4-deoxy-L-arabinose transferase-like glycosyltransferase
MVVHYPTADPERTVTSNAGPAIPGVAELAPSGHSASRDAIEQREILLVTALTVVALVLRAWSLSKVGIGQYDEGVYALSGLGLSHSSQPYRMFPRQERFSPPIYIALVTLSFLVSGPSAQHAVAVNVILGALTVPLLWWVTRRWFGPGAAIAAAVLLALNSTHILVSRTGLTDISFAFVFLLALAALVWSLEGAEHRGAGWRAMVAGLAVGLAWNTKYHGWFALLITLGAILIRWRVARADRKWLLAALRSWTWSALVAGLCFIPWAVFIQSSGSRTGGLVRYYSTMLRLDWSGNFLRYAQQLWMLEGPPGRIALPLAALAVSLVARDPRGQRRMVPWPVVAALSVSAIVLGLAATTLLAALFALFRRRTDGALVTWVLAGWIALWAVAAPFYQPYFRLLLPILIANFMLTGWLLADIAEENAAGAGAPWTTWLATIGMTGVVAVIALRLPVETHPWADTRSAEVAAQALSARVPTGTPVRVVGEPPVAFYLHRLGHPSFGDAHAAEMDSAATVSYFVTGAYARRSPELRDMLRRHRDELQELGRIAMRPTDLRLLDDNRPAAARAYRAAPDSGYDLVLYRYTPKLLAR